MLKALRFLLITSLVSIGLISCNLLGLPRAIVVNQSGQTIINARLTLCQQTETLPDLPPSGTYTWQFRPKQDCSLDVEGKLADGTLLKGDGTYSTPGDNAEFRLMVLANGTVSYDHVTGY